VEELRGKDKEERTRVVEARRVVGHHHLGNCAVDSREERESRLSSALKQYMRLMCVRCGAAHAHAETAARTSVQTSLFSAR
jgi:hypothetical protein